MVLQQRSGKNETVAAILTGGLEWHHFEESGASNCCPGAADPARLQRLERPELTY